MKTCTKPLGFLVMKTRKHVENPRDSLLFLPSSQASPLMWVVVNIRVPFGGPYYNTAPLI